MRRDLRVPVALLAIAVALVGVAVIRKLLTPRPYLANASPSIGDVCRMPLEGACSEGSCPSYDALAMAVRAKAGRAGKWTQGEIGTCGTGSYIWRGGSAVSRTDYFDSAKRFVGEERSVDDLTLFCDGTTGDARYGEVPECAKVPTEVIEITAL